MAITITATIRCDRCERDQAVIMSEDSLAADAYHVPVSNILRDANELDRYGWKLVDRDGRGVYDQHLGAARLLCGPCAEEYRRFVERQRADEDAFMGKA